MGFTVTFHTEEDLEKHPKELKSYQEAERLKLPIFPALSYTALVNAAEQNHWIIVY